MSRITEALENKNKNYIFPFLWLHGESKEILLDNIHKIYDSGIKAFCIESRPHPDFLGEQWWHDLDLILNEAKKLKMKVWILDDSHFPTGYANGKVKNDLKQYLKKFLYIKQLDFRGPQKDATVILKYLRPDKRFLVSNPHEDQSEKILKVIAARKVNDNEIDPNTLIDVTEFLKNDLLEWDIPNGEWRIFTLIQTIHGGEKETEGYLNPIETNATKVLLDTVYEPHFDHYKQYFGNVIAGFFSDEPRLGNHHGANSRIGTDEMVLPWRPNMLNEFFKDDYLELPLLTTVSANGVEKKIRYKYMDIVSKLYGDNFTKTLSNWCHEHGVEYIGHLIEDNGSHTRLGYGAGHYFRALDAQDMAGIDVVLNQIMPGMDKNWFKSMTGSGWNGEFFHYGLAKMGASLGHLDPKKHGNTMSEVFGAYGWAEGLTLMKFIADHMIVRGVNHFVPHAFDPNKFPDPDCPPHFYANGHEPENRAYSELFNYMNRLSHIFSGGKHLAHVAVLYHAEEDWINKNTMPFEKPVRVLMQHQIDCEITPLDYLSDSKISNGYFEINHEKFDTLVIPYSKYVSHNLISVLKKLERGHINIIFVNDYPELDENNKIITNQIKAVGKVSKLDDIFENVSEKDISVRASDFEKYLRFYDYSSDINHQMMFVNENPSRVINTKLTTNMSGKIYGYDAMRNTLTLYNTDGSNTIGLHLYPGQSIVLVNGEEYGNADFKHELSSESVLNSKTIIASFADAEEYPKFNSKIKLDKLININSLPNMRDFSGNIKYQINFNITNIVKGSTLNLGTVNEIASVKLNGYELGTRISYPYSYDNIDHFLKMGENELEVIIINNLGMKQQDFLSQYMLLKPSGLLGPITLEH